MIEEEDIRQIKEHVDATFFYGKTILITGSTGFIGRNLVRFFTSIVKEAGAGKVIALCRDTVKANEVFRQIMDDKFLEIICQNIYSMIKIDGEIDYIIHAASIASTGLFESNAVDVIKANILGTCNLLEVAKEKKVKGFLFLSSGAIYGDDSDAQHDVTEDEYYSIDSMKVKNCYALSKKMGENACISYWKQYGVPAKIVRIAHTYGPGIDLNDGHIYSDFTKAVLRGENILIKGTGIAQRPFCYITDAIEAFCVIIVRGEIGQAYNMANNNEIYAIRDLAYKLSKDIFKAKKLEVNFLNSKDSSRKIENEVSIDTRKLENLGWCPSVNIEEGFVKTVNSFVNDEV